MIARTLSTLVSVRCKCSDNLNVEGDKFYLTCVCDCVRCGGLMSLHNWKLPPGLSGQCTAVLNWLGALQPTPVFRWIHVFGLREIQFHVPRVLHGSYFWANFSVLCLQRFTCTGWYFCFPRVSHWARDLEWGSALTRAGRGPSLSAKVLLLLVLDKDKIICKERQSKDKDITAHRFNHKFWNTTQLVRSRSGALVAQK